MGMATRVGEKRAREVDERSDNRGAGSRTCLDPDEPSVPAGDAHLRGYGGNQTRNETEREE